MDKDSKFLIDYIGDSRKTTSFGKESKDEYMCSTISYQLYLTAEFLTESAFKERCPQTSAPPFFTHKYVSVAILAYANALDAYLNEIISFWLERHSEKDAIKEQIKNGTSLIENGYTEKLRGFYKIFELKQEDFQKHEDMQILFNVRHEIAHFFPYMLDRTECRNRVASALTKAGIKFDDRGHWSFYLQDVRLLEYFRQAFKDYINQLCEKGFRHLDMEEHWKRLEKRGSVAN